ncbi:hypothetical protein diail_7026 [Diaporthe ilicicola]|nr:hypothetical protein diail_7026 [Diaporthe ilicicola]
MSSLTVNTYRQYKQDTESMLTWLSESLNGLGIAFDGKLEDTTDKQQLQLADRPPGILELASRAKLAGAVMPYGVVHSLEHALKVRRQYHTWYSNQISREFSKDVNKRIQESNKAHAAFINVLQCIHDLFTPAKTQASHSQQSSPTNEGILEITNMFAKLEAEDIAESEQKDSSAKPPSGIVPAAQPWVQNKARMLIEDKLLELYCLYDDANKICEYLRNKWTDYSLRKIDLKSVSLTTQAAVELFADVEKAFDLKYGTLLKDNPDFFIPKYLDIFFYLSIGELFDPTFPDDSSSSSTKQVKTAARALAEEYYRRIEASQWGPSEDLDNWIFRPVEYAIVCMMQKGDDWISKQACRAVNDRSDDLDASMKMPSDVEAKNERRLCTAARQYMDTCIDFYAGILLLRQNKIAFLTPPDFTTRVWVDKQYDCSILMVLCVQILHNIHTVKPQPGHVNIMAQVSGDYKKLGEGLADYKKDCGRELSPGDYEMFQKRFEYERSWLDGRIPVEMSHLNNKKKKRAQRLQKLPLQVNPALGGLFLFNQSFIHYNIRIKAVNRQWFLAPFAHLFNWLVLASSNTSTDAQKIWPDLHTALRATGPRPIWMGSEPPETLGQCRNRMLLAWGLPLKEFYQSMKSGHIPQADELYTRIRGIKSKDAKISAEVMKALRNNASWSEISSSLGPRTAEPQKRTGKLLEIGPSQPIPLLVAVYENLESSHKARAQQAQIRKIVLAKDSAVAQKGSHEPESDMLSYIDAFSRAAQAEMPRLMFPYSDFASLCFDVACYLYINAQDVIGVPASLRISKKTPRGEMFGDGPQSVCSLLALYMMFGERPPEWSLPSVEKIMLEFIEKDWEKESGHRKDAVTKEFAAKCKEFGFAFEEPR